MSDRFPKQTPTPGSPNSALKPALKAVLESLDVQLETELTRYRRQKRGEQVQPTYGGNGMAPAQKPTVNLMNLSPSRDASEGAGLSSGQPPAPRKLEGDKPLHLLQSGEPAAASSANGTNGSSVKTTASPSQDSELSDRQEESDRTALDSSEPAAAIVPVSQQDSSDRHFESSEQLVKNLDADSRDRRRTRRRRRTRDSWLTPLGVGSMLLFLVASGTLVYVLTHPAPKNQPTESDRTTAQTDSTSGEQQPLSVTPDLTNPQFKPLELERLGTLKEEPATSAPAPSPTAAAPTAPAVSVPSGAPSALQTPAPSLENLNTDYLTGTSSGQAAANQPPSNTPSGAPPTTAASASPAATATASPAPGSSVSASSFPAFYYVVMDYQNDENLWKAREVVPDAYVREFPIGVKVQVAAFEDEASAKMMVEQMVKQGMSAKIYKP